MLRMPVSRLLDELIDRALDEDGAWSDHTSLGLTNAREKVRATICARQDLVMAGLGVAFQTFRRLSDTPVSWKTAMEDGKRVKAGEPVAGIEGEAWVILAGERTALNFIQRLSGIATLTSLFVERIAGTKAKIVDTRKTTPGMRALEKYTVRCGGGLNHRFGLHDGCLIKDNHIRLAGGITPAVNAIRGGISHLWRIEVEAETLDQVAECLNLGVDAVLLDNMSVPVMAKAVDMIEGRMLVEASGGITIENVAEVARTGVDLISIGALTHSSKAADIALELD